MTRLLTDEQKTTIATLIAALLFPVIVVAALYLFPEVGGAV